MKQRTPGFPGEYLWELEIARLQLLALAEAVPQEVYHRSPAAGARPFSAVLVHIATVNLVLLRLLGVQSTLIARLYGDLQGGEIEQIAAMVHRNMSAEAAVIGKPEVLDLLTKSLDAVEQAISTSSPEALDQPGDYFGERTTVRRVYLRMLAHTHEHMGQAIAYARMNGIPVPWPDPLAELDKIAAEARSQ